MADPDPLEILEELTAIIEHERAEHILSGYWQFDPKVPVPSVAVLRMLGEGLVDYEVARETVEGDEVPASFASVDESRAVTTIITLLREMPRADLKKRFFDSFVKQSAADLRFRERHTEWNFSVWHYYFSPCWGAKFIAGHLMGLLQKRALRTGDHQALIAHGELIRAYKTGEPLEASKPEVVASHILGFLPSLHRLLGRQPHKEEVKMFLLTSCLVAEETSSGTWARAFDIAGFSKERDRTGTRNSEDRDKVKKLALVLRKNREVSSTPLD